MNIFVETRKIKNTNIVNYFGLNDDNEILFKNTFIDEHSGVIEFIACVHALMYAKKNNLNADVYVENEYIKSCVEQKNYKHKAKSEKGEKLLRQSSLWLLDQRQTIIIYTNTI